MVNKELMVLIKLRNGAKDAANMRLVRARRRLADKLADWASLVG